MAIKAYSEWVLGRKQTPTSGCAGTVVAQRFEITVGVALSANDIVELGVLPAFHTVVDAILDIEAMGAGVKADVGVMSGTPGSQDGTRTCGAELFDDQDVANATVVRASASSAFTIAPVAADRGIGIKVSDTVAAGKKIALTLFMVQ